MHSTEHHRKLNSPEAAEYLGISVSTLSKRRVDGDGPKYLKLGRRVVYDTRDLDDWLDSHSSNVDVRRWQLDIAAGKTAQETQEPSARHRKTYGGTTTRYRPSAAANPASPTPRASCGLAALPAKRFNLKWREGGPAGRGRTRPTGQGFCRTSL